MQFTDKNKASDQLRLSGLIIDEELCINLRGRMMLCSACQQACPSEALTLSVDAVDLDKAKCTGCNSCTRHCAAGALHSSGFIPERFLSTLSAEQAVHVHCRNSHDKGGGVVIPCHQVLDERLLSAARADGVSEIFLHGLERCASCDMGDARAHIESLKQQLTLWLGEQAIQLHRAQPRSAVAGAREYQDQATLDRRSFLRFGGAKAVQSVAQWVVPGLSLEEEEEQQDAQPFYQADEFIQRPSLYLAALLERVQQVPWAQSAELPWPGRSVSEACTVCLSCAERCPTGALSRQQNNQLRSLSYDAALCTNCQLCENICPVQAFIVNPLESINEVLSGRSLLNQVAQTVCAQCATAFTAAAHQTLCPICINEQNIDDEWLDMLSG